ncbi:MAG: TetR/AcrR family transcriptional regulator [Candidatus Planktophila sp.]|jgi:AcrR family transcriptional regulator
MIAKDRILEAATELFYKRGVNATGIDLIISEAGIAKATLYNNFESKEVLVAKYLERLRLKFEENLQQAVSKQGRSLTIPFDLLETTVVQGEFFGCPFTNALTELPESTLVQEEVRKYRGVVLNYFSEFATKEIVQQLMLVYDGAFTSCKLDPNRKGVRVARQLAQQLVDLANS